MLGSAISIACPNIMLNTIAAEEFRQFADELEGSDDLERDVRKIVQRVMGEHGRIIFNGDGYSAAWQQGGGAPGAVEPAHHRGRPAPLLDEKNVELFARHSIYTRAEMEARYETALEGVRQDHPYRGFDHEQMAHRDVFPAVEQSPVPSGRRISAQRIACKDLPCAGETKLLKASPPCWTRPSRRRSALDFHLAQEEVGGGDILTQATYYKNSVLPPPWRPSGPRWTGWRPSPTPAPGPIPAMASSCSGYNQRTRQTFSHTRGPLP